MEEIPAIVRDWNEQKRLEAALIENLQRDDLNPIDEAEGIRKLMQESSLTQEAVSQRLGKSRPAVANALRLLTLPEPVRKLLVEGSLSAGHARALIGLDAQRQVQLANLAVQQGWSVRQMERICKEAETKPKRSAKVKRDQQLIQLETMARELFGTRVRLDGTAEGGRMTLYYYNADDLQRIWDILAAIGESGNA